MQRSGANYQEKSTAAKNRGVPRRMQAGNHGAGCGVLVGGRCQYPERAGESGAESAQCRARWVRKALQFCQQTQRGYLRFTGGAGVGLRRLSQEPGATIAELVWQSAER